MYCAPIQIIESALHLRAFPVVEKLTQNRLGPNRSRFGAELDRRVCLGALRNVSRGVTKVLDVSGDGGDLGGHVGHPPYLLFSIVFSPIVLLQLPAGTTRIFALLN